MARVKHYLGQTVYPFALDIPGIDELESETDTGLWHLFARVHSQACSSSEVQHIFRLGLIGAGMKEDEALRLTSVHVVPGRLEKARGIAELILKDCLEEIETTEREVDEDKLGKPKGGPTTRSKSSPTAGSTSRPSTRPSSKRASRRKPSKGSAAKT